MSRKRTAQLAEIEARLDHLEKTRDRLTAIVESLVDNQQKQTEFMREIATSCKRLADMLAANKDSGLVKNENH